MKPIKLHSTYSVVTETYAMHVEYSYYYDSGDYYQPPDEEIDIKSVSLDGIDITDFYWDWIDDRLDEEIYEHARGQL